MKRWKNGTVWRYATLPLNGFISVSVHKYIEKNHLKPDYKPWLMTMALSVN
ncbi:hypothetical protein [Rudanella paleaurantiibacter]|uniref:hypothetical protein n=1 Tax=Rudanella paleaurantiibacter TaxID=2614655 RepID=UPI001627D72D|nr:hypothetical protein [Rudanella paleaurantiibacter]